MIGWCFINDLLFVIISLRYSTKRSSRTPCPERFLHPPAVVLHQGLISVIGELERVLNGSLLLLRYRHEPTVQLE